MKFSWSLLQLKSPHPPELSAENYMKGIQQKKELMMDLPTCNGEECMTINNLTTASPHIQYLQTSVYLNKCRYI